MFLHIFRTDIHDRVAVDDIALLIYSDAAVRVAVEREADIQMIVHDILSQRLRMRCAAVHVDVEAVRSVSDHIGVRTQRVKDALGDLPGATVGAIETDTEVFVRTGRQRDQIADVAVPSRSVVDGLADLFPLCERKADIAVEELFQFFDE